MDVKCSLVCLSLLLVVGCNRAENELHSKPTLLHERVTNALASVKRNPSKSRQVFEELGALYIDHKDDWTEREAYALETFECPLEAALNYVGLLCTMADHDDSDAIRWLGAMRVQQQHKEVLRSLLEVLEEAKQPSTYASAWKVVEAGVVEVRPSNVYEFVFVVR